MPSIPSKNLASEFSLSRLQSLPRTSPKENRAHFVRRNCRAVENVDFNPPRGEHL